MAGKKKWVTVVAITVVAAAEGAGVDVGFLRGGQLAPRLDRLDRSDRWLPDRIHGQLPHRIDRQFHPRPIVTTFPVVIAVARPAPTWRAGPAPRTAS